MGPSPSQGISFMEMGIAWGALLTSESKTGTPGTPTYGSLGDFHQFYSEVTETNSIILTYTGKITNPP